MPGVSTPGTPVSLALDAGLFIRQPALGDAPIIYDSVDRGREDLRVWLPWVDATQSVADTVEFIEGSQLRRSAGEAYVYGIWEDLEFCGVIDLHAVDELNACAQIGYWLKPEARGHGLVTQAAAALLGISFEILGLERIEIRCAVGNEASASIPLRLGFTEEALLRHAQRFGDGFKDLRLFRLLLAEYRALLKPAL